MTFSGRKALAPWQAWLQNLAFALTCGPRQGIGPPHSSQVFGFVFLSNDCPVIGVEVDSDLDGEVE